MPELCLCNFCTQFGGRERCRGKLRRILVTVVEEVDAPLWLCRYAGRYLPVKFYGGTPSVGGVYLAWLLCLSGEYVVFLLEAGGVFYVLYEDPQYVYQVTVGESYVRQDAWISEGEFAEFIGAGVQQQAKVVLTTEDRAALSTDAAASWATALVANELRRVRFDRSEPGLGWIGRIPTFTAADKVTIRDQHLAGLGTGNYAPATVHADYVDFRSAVLPVDVYKTTNGGSGWTKLTPGYLGQQLPIRITGSDYETLFEDAGGCGFDAHGVVCTWETYSDPPDSGTEPCMAGSTVVITQEGNPRDIASRWSSGWGSVEEYAICSGDWDDVNRLEFAPPSFIESVVAPAHDGLSCYVAVAASYRDEEWSGATPSGYATPFLQRKGSTWDTLYATVIYRSTGASWTVPAASLEFASEYLSEGLAVDPNNASRLYAVSGWWNVWKLDWNSQTVTKISPTAAANVGYAKDVVVADDGSVLVPMVYWDGAAYVFGVWRSSNEGATWAFTDLDAESGDRWNESCMMAVNSAGTVGMMLQSGKFAYSTDHGGTWTVTSAVGEAAEWVQDITGT